MHSRQYGAPDLAVQSTQKDMIPASNATDAHAQDFLASCYCASWKNPHITFNYNTVLEMFDVFSVCIVAELYVASANILPSRQLSPRTAPATRTGPRGFVVCAFDLYKITGLLFKPNCLIKYVSPANVFICRNHMTQDADFCSFQANSGRVN